MNAPSIKQQISQLQAMHDDLEERGFGLSASQVQSEIENLERQLEDVDETELIEKLKRARGVEYVQLFRLADSTVGERLRQEICEYRESMGRCRSVFLEHWPCARTYQSKLFAGC